jgi:cysteinyl-tRNA synthetase
MAMQHLGETFDIHGGGLDLQFPHHENEIAQSEAASGHPFAQYWMHVGMLQVNDEKMSKSTGNFYTIEDVLKLYHPEVVRYFLLSSHYRSSLNYVTETLTNCSKALMRLYQSLKGIDYQGISEWDDGWVTQFRTAMLDDFNTPIALSVLFQLSHELNKSQSPHLAATLCHLGGVLGILQESPDHFLQALLPSEEKEIAAITALIAQRDQARLEKNWTLSDSIRQELAAKGVELEDSKAGTTWRWIV